MTIEVSAVSSPGIDISQVVFVRTEVTTTTAIDMRSVLLANSMWLVLEGFDNGYASTEAGVDRLHIILHDTIQPQSAVDELHTLVQDELATLLN